MNSKPQVPQLLELQVRRDLSGRSFEQLLDLAASIGGRGLIVMRHGEEVHPSASQVAQQLQEYGSVNTNASEWPGTILIDDTATVINFAVNTHSLCVVAAASSSLLSWQHPQLPEDLCFLRPSGQAWLTTIAHEGDAFLQLLPEEVATVAVRQPDLYRSLEPVGDAGPE